MALYTVKNTSEAGSVFVSLRGIQSISRGKSKTVELSEADRNHHEIVALEEAGHLSVEPCENRPVKSAAEAKPEAPKVEAPTQKADPKVEAPKVEPKVEAPRVEPKKDDPKKVEPVAKKAEGDK